MIRCTKENRSADKIKDRELVKAIANYIMPGMSDAAGRKQQVAGRLDSWLELGLHRGRAFHSNNSSAGVTANCGVHHFILNFDCPPGLSFFFYESSEIDKRQTRILKLSRLLQRAGLSEPQQGILNKKRINSLTACCQWAPNIKELLDSLFRFAVCRLTLKAHIIRTWAITAWNGNIQQTQIDSKLCPVMNNLRNSHSKHIPFG